MKGDHWMIGDIGSNWQILTVLGVLICLMLIFDFVRIPAKRRLFRWLSYLLISAGLIGLMIKPKLRTKSNSDYIIVLTDHYSPEILDSLMDAMPNAQVLTKLNNDQKPSDRISESILDIYELIDNHPNVHSLAVLGVGLSDQELTVMPYQYQYFEPGSITQGLIKIRFDQTVIEGKSTTISGYLRGSEGVKILLHEDDVKIDSTEADESGYFELFMTPKVSGQYLYSLSTFGGKDLLDTYPVPIEVIPEVNLNVLIVNQFPVFDTKYLRGHLVKSGHQVVVRSKYSKNKFNYEYYNTEDRSAIDLSAKAMGKYDLLIIDYQSLIRLTKSQIDNLKVMIKQYGLSLLLQNIALEDDISRTPFLQSFSLSEDSSSEFMVSDNIAISGSGVSMSGSHIPIKSVHSERILGGYQWSGLGKIGVLTSQNTYELVLNGNGGLYGALWDDVLDNMKKRSQKPYQLIIEQQIPIVNEPFDITIVNNTNQHVKVKFDKTDIPIRQNYHINSQWSGRHWSDQSGWHSFKLGSDIIVNRYIFEHTDWSSLRRVKQIQNNKQRASMKSSDSNNAINYSYQLASPIVFYLLILMGCAYLWVESKL